MAHLPSPPSPVPFPRKATYEGQLCIAKIPVVTLSDREKQLLLRSAAIHARVHHPCVETVLTVSTEPGSEVVLTEYIPGGNLQVHEGRWHRETNPPCMLGGWKLAQGGEGAPWTKP